MISKSLYKFVKIVPTLPPNTLFGVQSLLPKKHNEQNFASQNAKLAKVQFSKISKVRN